MPDVKRFLYVVSVIARFPDHNYKIPMWKTQSFKGTSLFLSRASLWIQFTSVQKKEQYGFYVSKSYCEQPL